MQHVRLALVAGLLLTAGPAFAASCADEIAALEGRLKEQATSAISASSGSKEVASSREAEAVVARNRDVPVSAMPNAAPSGSAEAKGAEKAEQAGGGGDRVIQAKATLNRAHTLEQRGDAAGCVQAVAEARRQLED